MVRDVCLVVVTMTLLGMAGWMVYSEVRTRRELESFRERVAQRVVAQWQYPREPPALPAEG